MFWIMLLVGGAVWGVARVGDKTRSGWMIRNFFFRIVFFAGLAASFSRGSYIGSDVGVQFGLVFAIWFFWILVIGVPATIIYYFLKVRRLKLSQSEHLQQNVGFLSRFILPREVRITLGAATAGFFCTKPWSVKSSCPSACS